MLLKLISVLFFFISISSILVESRCTRGCDLAFASYYVWSGVNLTFISEVLSSPFVPSTTDFNPILINNKQVQSKDNISASTRLNVPFPCECNEDGVLAYRFSFKVRRGDTYTKIATEYYSNLTTVASLQRYNWYSTTNIPDTGTVNVTVNCSCGDAAVSKDYGLFITYPLQPGETWKTVLNQTNLTSNFLDLVQSYNPHANFNALPDFVFIPGRDANDSFRPLKSSAAGISGGVIAGITLAVIAVLLLLAVGLYVGYFRKKKEKGATVLPAALQDSSAQAGNVFGSKAAGSTAAVAASPGLIAGITVDKSVEFSYEELYQATDNFSMAKKIGEGGFGAVYYANLRGEEAAIKKMDMQASKEFLAELKVLTHVHHLNLVRLIGYCTEGSLFLVYEFIENGNLSQHLRGSRREPLPWPTRLQIALDSARGLEYIHEHTVPVYIHRDIKSANILINKNFRAKVADFGLTKLTEVGNLSLPTRLVGTFGYMAPEYARYGDVSLKVDVYAFGVVLYELISAKEAIIRANDSGAESTGLVALFEDALNEADPKEEVCKLIDPRLGDNYPLDSVFKVIQLAKACTEENPELRPTMRSIVVALTTLSSSSTDDWNNVGSFYDNQALLNLMSGR